MSVNEKIMTHRYIARIVLEAETPLFVGSGETSVTSDAIVMRDAYGYPMIPGTSLTGVLRHALEDASKDKLKWNSFFGYQEPARGSKGKGEGEGSQLRVSSAYLILDGKIPDGSNDQYFKDFANLPVRQHVRIDDCGVAEKQGLYDNEVVYKGCRYVFEMELRGTAEDKSKWEDVLKILHSPVFRIGQGTRNGYGRLKVLGVREHIFDLRDERDFDAYLNYDNKLDLTGVTIESANFDDTDNTNNQRFIQYELKLTPELGFIFGSGTGDDEVDALPVSERVVAYDADNRIRFEEAQVLIPGSSIKGALRHRTCFYYNKRKQRYAEVYAANSELRKLVTGVGNKAVYDLFGVEGGWDGAKHDGIIFKDNVCRASKRGKVLINDIYIPTAKLEKIFNHVSIDRFTGGARDGFLFSEKVATLEESDDVIQVKIAVFGSEDDFDTDVIGALEDAFQDICNGLLPLGGMTTKGHGIFTGSLLKNGQKIYSYEEKA